MVHVCHLGTYFPEKVSSLKSTIENFVMIAPNFPVVHSFCLDNILLSVQNDNRAYVYAVSHRLLQLFKVVLLSLLYLYTKPDSLCHQIVICKEKDPVAV